jgi:tetratricopeptide (TPR) repeat protein
VVRSNIADELVKLGRHDEARQEIERAIECKRPFGHAAQPWTLLAILSNLERAVSNEPAALAARRQAIELYLSYRRDGGHPQLDANKIAAMVAKDPAAARARMDDPNLHPVVAAEIMLALEGHSA